ncbi:MAG: SOS response-associated peptidase [Gemmataceae bacterium]
MCGRYTLITSAGDVSATFAVADVPPLVPRYNVAPTQPILIVRQSDGARRAEQARWGLTPPWATGGRPLINARADTVATKPAFRAAFRSRRCLVPADGFYEWETIGKKKAPNLFATGGLFAVAGLYDHASDPAACLITTEANPLVAAVHDRMPVILPPEAWAAWLNPTTDPAALLPLLAPYPADRMSRRNVSDAVNSARVEGPRCHEPPVASLFG